MPRHKDERNRVLGPVWIPSAGTEGLWRIVVVTPGAPRPKDRRTTSFYREKADADEVAKKAREKLEALETLTLDQALTAYDRFIVEKGAKDVWRKEALRRLRLFFPDHGTLLARVTPDRAKEYYDAFRTHADDNGRTRSVSYHRAALSNVRSFFTWCFDQKWVTENPFVHVRGVGRKNAGKLQHTGDETRKLYAYCLARAEEGDDAALGVLMALLMALRSKDIYSRVVRDVDLDATQLRVEHGKTTKSNRPRRIPVVLQPLLRQLAADRPPFEPLFKTPYTETGFHTRRWLEEAMVRFCEAAGVPYVCPHALKGTAGTILAETGTAADAIADHLSHEETSTTRKHYIAPGALADGQAERALQVIAGGKK